MTSDNDNPSPSWFSKLLRPFHSIPENREEINELLQQIHTSRVIDSDALGIMEGALRIMDKSARDIMIPLSQMEILNTDNSLEQCLQTIIETGHSRFPVMGEAGEDICGILLAKDIIAQANYNNQGFDLKSLLRPAHIIPESKRLMVLLREFRGQRYHMAMVIDEYGSISGLITIEDILEEIVGDIEDETDEKEDEPIKALGNGEYSLKTQLAIEDFNERFNSDFSDKDYDTLGGMLINSFGYIPKVGESIEEKQFKFTITESDDRRIICANLKIVDL